MSKASHIGKLLLSQKLIAPDQLDRALQLTPEGDEQELGRTLIRLGYITGASFNKALSLYLGIPSVQLKDLKIDSQAPHLLPEDLLRRHNIIPIRVQGEQLDLAMAPPVDLNLVEEIRLTLGYKVRPMLATERDIVLALNRHFTPQKRTQQTLIDMHVDEHSPMAGTDDIIINEVVENVESPPIVRLVVDIIDGAINERSSDIHLEPQETDTRVRYRIDGVLQDVMRLPRNIEASVISRVKILAGMDITEKRASQDGHISIKKGKKDFDIRASTFLTVNGEKVVMRVLSKQTMLIKLEDLGFNHYDLEMTKGLIARPYGMILVTGPTGSGKTTTLYSVLNRIDFDTENVVTIEDPVEYRLPGINQTQVNASAGITFATGLRSILRQDPNVIMIGEIRDKETAEMAIQAAMTGHLVFSTLHTSDAPSAVTRLMDMGIQPYQIASAVIGVLAQRLVRVICAECRQAYNVDAQELMSEFGLEASHAKTFRVFRGNGCQYCYQQGYLSRTGVFEVMNLTPELQELIATVKSPRQYRALAIKQGMSSLRHAAFQKIIQGVTSIEEVKRSIFLGI